jgi:hypothetical protein
VRTTDLVLSPCAPPHVAIRPRRPRENFGPAALQLAAEPCRHPFGRLAAISLSTLAGGPEVRSAGDHLGGSRTSGIWLNRNARLRTLRRRKGALEADLRVHRGTLSVLDTD